MIMPIRKLKGKRRIPAIVLATFAATPITLAGAVPPASALPDCNWPYTFFHWTKNETFHFAPGTFCIKNTRDNARLVYQEDGNLVLYRGQVQLPRYALWSSRTHGQLRGHLSLQGDGNIVIYGGDGGRLWASNTWNYWRPATTRYCLDVRLGMANDGTKNRASLGFMTTPMPRSAANLCRYDASYVGLWFRPNGRQL